MAKTRSCREFIEILEHSIINCANCKHWNAELKRCNEEARVVAAHEVEFDKYDREMRNNRAVYLG